MKQFNHQSDIFELSKIRRRVVLAGLLILFISLFSRALYLQQIKKEFLQSKGNNFSIRNEILHSYRGKIYDRNNKLLAVSSPTFDVGINLSFKNDDKNIRVLAELLEIDSSQLIEKVNSKSKGFSYIKRSVSPEKAKKISSLGLKGLSMEKKYRRFYPNRESAAHIIGKTDLDGIGNEGLEKQWDSFLKGEMGHKKVLVDGGKRIIDDLQDFKLPKDGSDIHTTIDGRLQHSAYEALKKYVQRYDADAGSAIMIDAKTGDILLMTNYPSYNPNSSIKNLETMRNRVVTDTFEPGSTMKPLSIAYAMDSKKVKENEIIQTNNGLLKVGRSFIRDDHPHDEMTLKEVVKYSSNVGAAQIGVRLSPKELWGFYDKVGFGKKINIGIPGEVGGRLRNYASWRESEHARMPFGYGMSINLLQLASAYSVFANDGIHITPKLYLNKKPEIGDKILTPKTSNTMKNFMVSVVEEDGGTGFKARIPGYTVAGKTGTARKVVEGNYVKEYVASFVGIAPSTNPKFIMAVMIDNPRVDSYYGGTVAGPVFKDTMKDALKLYDIPHDKDIKENLLEITNNNTDNEKL